MSWKSALISKTVKIREAIKTIDAAALQIALVVDANGKLLGTVTDGDVRRAILKDISLDEAVEKIMMKTPVTASLDQSRESILTMMEHRQIRQVPIVDAQGRITGIEVLDDLLQRQTKENWVVLMAGGLGSRLSPLTDDCPKPLLKVGKKPILETILENFIEYNFHHFFISVNYKDQMLKEYFGDGSRWGIKIQYLHESEKLGTAGALGLLEETPKKPLIVMNGDLLTKVNFRQLLDFHAEHKAAATMCVREYDFQVPYGVVRLDNKNEVTAIDEKPVQRFFVNAGIYVLEPKVLSHVSKNKALDMPVLFERLIAEKSTVTAFPVREYWMDIGRLDDFQRANGEFPAVFE